jgi:hypothetical protein
MSIGITICVVVSSIIGRSKTLRPQEFVNMPPFGSIPIPAWYDYFRKCNQNFKNTVFKNTVKKENKAWTLPTENNRDRRKLVFFLVGVQKL